jgi:hypothetical protein
VSFFLVQHQVQVRQRTEIQTLLRQSDSLKDANETLSKQLVESTRKRTRELPARSLVEVQPTAGFAREATVATNLYALMTNNNAELTVEQLDRYLECNQRSAVSLLAAFRTTGEPELLAEAALKDPDHPQVNFEGALRKDVTPEERRHWLDALKRVAPDNALANYLSAADYFRNAQTDQAVQELVAASGKSEFKDYTRERLQDDEEAYRSAGYSVAESQLLASQLLLLPQLMQTKELSGQMLALANSYHENGDEA